MGVLEQLLSSCHDLVGFFEEGTEGGRFRRGRQATHTALKVGQVILDPRHLSIDQLKLTDKGIIELDRKFGGQPQRLVVVFDLTREGRGGLQQVSGKRLIRLPEVVNLDQVDQTGFQVRFQQREGPALQAGTVLVIADLLHAL